MEDGIRQLDVDIPLLAGLHAFGQVEVKRVALADAGESILSADASFTDMLSPPDRRAISEVPAD